MKTLFVMLLVLAGCGDSNYNGTSTPSTSGTSPVEQSSVQEVLDCASAVQTASIDVQPNNFVPASATISRGQIVKFENRDAESHSITSGTLNNPDRLFDITLSPNGEQFDERCLKFTAPGSFNYYDKLHPLMNGVIVVL